MLEIQGNSIELYRALVDTYESVQKERIRAENRLRNILKGMDEGDPLREKVLEKLSRLKELEKGIAKDLLQALEEEPIYTEFLSKVKGIGSVYAVRLLALNLRLGVPLSAWNAYFGLVPSHVLGECQEGHKFMYPKETSSCPVEVGAGEERKRCGAPIVKLEEVKGAPRRKRGYKPFWSPRARKLYFLIAKQWVRMGENGFYPRLYRRIKTRIESRADLQNLPKIRRDAMAMRSVFKLFLAHYYQASHELRGMEYRLPYAFEYLQHEQFIDWKEVIALGG